MDTETLARSIYILTINNGGCTKNINGDTPDNGYAVGAYPEQSIVVQETAISPEIIETYITTRQAILNQPGVHVGTWINENRVYLDLSVVYNDLDQAIERARQDSQLAIYDLSAGEEIGLVERVEQVV